MYLKSNTKAKAFAIPYFSKVLARIGDFMVRFYTPQVVPLKNGKYELSIRYRDESFKGVRKKLFVLLRIQPMHEVKENQF